MIFFAMLLLLSLLASEDTEIRIYNDSKVPMENVRVWFPSQIEDFGTIPPKGITEYRPVKRPFCLTRIEAVVDAKLAIIQPFDSFGEKALKAGKRYTYILSVNKKGTSEWDRLKLKCRRDSD